MLARSFRALLLTRFLRRIPERRIYLLKVNPMFVAAIKVQVISERRIYYVKVNPIFPRYNLQGDIGEEQHCKFRFQEQVSRSTTTLVLTIAYSPLHGWMHPSHRMSYVLLESRSVVMEMQMRNRRYGGHRRTRRIRFARIALLVC